LQAKARRSGVNQRCRRQNDRPHTIDNIRTRTRLSDTQLPAALLALVCIVFAFYIYFLPTFIAYRRRARARGWILLFNTFAAATIILWFTLLFWASSAEVKEQTPGH
jgi:Superinfection immunity protein